MASTIILTTGVPGSGKSYVRCACFLVDYFLLNSDGLHISNFPVNREEIAKEVVRRSNLFKSGFWAKITAPFRRKQHHITVEDILKRIIVIPDSILQSWRNEQSGPWNYFNGVELTESHIALDEIHNFISPTKSVEYLKKWDEFLGEIRHRGCTFEGLTQDILSVDPILKNRAGIRLELVPADTLRDPFFHITMSDWYELKACFTGEIKKCVFEREYQMRFSRWACLRTHRFYLNQDYFKYYNSYNASLSEKESGEVNENRCPKYEFQKRTKLSLVTWFCLKNIWTLAPRLIIFFFCIWLFFFGGFVIVLHGFMSGIGSISKANKKDVKIEKQVNNSSVKPIDSKDKKVSTPGQQKQEVVQESLIYKNMTEYDNDRLCPEVFYLVYGGDIHKSSEDFKEIKKELEELRKENAKGYAPVFFNEHEVFLKNGLRVYENYEFIEGQFKGKKVKFVSLKDRYYQLDDNHIIRMSAINQ